MGVDAKVVAFLRAHRGQDFCDKCLAAEVALGGPGNRGRNATMAGNVTRVLEAIPELFTREEARCSRCRDTKKVIRMNVEHGAAADAQMAARG